MAQTAVSRDFRVGEWVEVRSADEVLATLDEHGSLDGLPFMPEMLQYCGRKFRVYKSAHKTCDTIRDYNIRRMEDAVHLQELRCDGSGHQGCQAGCLIYWKHAWLKPVPANGVTTARTAPVAPPPANAWDRLIRTTHSPASQGDAEPLYRCQATEVLAATKEVRRRGRWDPRLYLQDLTSGNVSVWNFVRYGALAMLNAFVGRWLNRRVPHFRGALTGPTPKLDTQLQAGEYVQVRSKQEIMHTLDVNKKNRGLFFDVEMLPYCEHGTFRVLSRVERIIDEKTGKLIQLPNPCFILDGVTCSGMHSASRMFCPRHLYPFWREIWLRRVDQPDTAAGRITPS
jgi:hypothetical protein